MTDPNRQSVTPLKHVAPKPGEDYTVFNLSGQNQIGAGESVSRFVLHGPSLGSSGLGFETKDAADAKGQELARRAGVTLWYKADPNSDGLLLTETFRTQS